jgi:hypothetical protein
MPPAVAQGVAEKSECQKATKEWKWPIAGKNQLSIRGEYKWKREKAIPFGAKRVNSAKSKQAAQGLGLLVS